MEKGRLIGRGMTAEVYTWGQDKVLKLYYEQFGDEWVKYEARIGHTVHEAGMPSPAVFGMVEVDGRKGIILERIFGETILKHAQAEPWKIYWYIRQLAGLHFKIHQCSAAGLPSQKEKFTAAIGGISPILGDRKKRILEYMKSLPDGESICHGDLHIGNILVSDRGLVIIDWKSAYRGNPLGDIARTCLMISSPPVPIPPETSGMITTLSSYPRWVTCWTYLNEYMRLAMVRFEDIDAWILPVAAAKLNDRRPGEKEWLMDMVDQRLKQCP